MEESEEIYISVASIFKKFGIKSQTMDDIARHLGISKKTLYKYFKDKNDLVVKTLNHLNSADCKVIEQIAQNSENAIEESFAISKHVLDQFKDIHPNVWYDLERYHPKAMGFMDDHMKNVIYQWVCDNLKKGIEEGLYREDLKIPIIAGIYVSRIKDFFNPMIFKVDRYSFATIYVEAFRYHIRGIASEKGFEVLKNKVKKEKNNWDEF